MKKLLKYERKKFVSEMFGVNRTWFDYDPISTFNFPYQINQCGTWTLIHS